MIQGVVRIRKLVLAATVVAWVGMSVWPTMVSAATSAAKVAKTQKVQKSTSAKAPAKRTSASAKSPTRKVVAAKSSTRQAVLAKKSSSRVKVQMDSGKKPTARQLIGQAQTDKAVGSGKVSAADVAQKVFDAVATGQFYIYSHPQALGNVQSRMEAIVQGINPPDPFAAKPEVGEGLRKALREANT